MAVYSDAMDLKLGVPTLVHAQTEAAELGREAVRRSAWRQRLEREADALVVDHGRPRLEPWPGEVVPRNARALAATAEAKGWRVNIVEGADRCSVEGIRGREGFRAIWVRGRAHSGTWHEARTRYALIEDTRPEPRQNAKTKTSLANRRPVGVSRVHLSILGSPTGITIGVSTLVARVNAS